MTTLLFTKNDVIPFKKKLVLAEIIEKDNGSSISSIVRGNLKYLDEYLDKLGAKTLIIENDYVGRDFLDSYAGYIVESYKSYSKYCKRVHVFSEKLEYNKIVNTLKKGGSENIDKLLENYKGFFILRSIPVAVLGLTVLELHNEFENDALFGIRNYHISVFGREKKIKTLAFHEQDSLISACATASVWFVLNKIATSPRFYLKSPIEITKTTGILGNKGNRLFPNSGLSPYQICVALKKSHLEPLRYSFEDDYVKRQEILQLLYSYSHIGIPIIMVTELKNAFDKIELHAVTIVGIKSFKNNQNRLACNEVYLKSDFAHSYLAHDDQQGFFVEYRFISGKRLLCPWNYNFNEKRRKVKEIKKVKRINDKDVPVKVKQNVFVKIKSLIVPVYSKVRIDFKSIKDVISKIDIIFQKCFIKNIDYKDRSSMSWDIRLLFNKDYRDEVSNEKNISNLMRKKVLLYNFPKYIWVATLCYNYKKIYDFVFDPTSINDSCFLIHIFEYFHKEEAFGAPLKRNLNSIKPTLLKSFRNMDGKSWVGKIFEDLNVDYCVNKRKKEVKECKKCGY